jgi:hypothetical protein
MDLANKHLFLRLVEAGGLRSGASMSDSGLHTAEFLLYFHMVERGQENFLGSLLQGHESHA